MSSNGSLMPSDEQIAKVLGIPVEQYQREQQGTEDRMWKIMRHINEERVRAISEQHRAAIEQDPNVLPYLLSMYKSSLESTTHVDESGAEKTSLKLVLEPRLDEKL